MKKSIRPYRLKHKATGLYYTKRSLSERGKVYSSAGNYMTFLGKASDVLVINTDTKVYRDHKEAIGKIGVPHYAWFDSSLLSHFEITVKADDFEIEYFEQDLCAEDPNSELSVDWLVTQEINGVKPAIDTLAAVAGMNAIDWFEDECNRIYALKVTGTSLWSFCIYNKSVCETVKKCNDPMLELNPLQTVYISTKQEFFMLRNMIQYKHNRK